MAQFDNSDNPCPAVTTDGKHNFSAKDPMNMPMCANCGLIKTPTEFIKPAWPVTPCPAFIDGEHNLMTTVVVPDPDGWSKTECTMWG